MAFMTTIVLGMQVRAVGLTMAHITGTHRLMPLGMAEDAAQLAMAAVAFFQLGQRFTVAAGA